MPTPAPLFDLEIQDFDWLEPIPTTLLTTIAVFGDHAMRLNAAASPSINAETAKALLVLGDESIAQVLRENPAAPQRALAMAVHVKQFARVARRDARRDAKRAENFRSTYVSTFTRDSANRELAAEVAR